MCVYLGVKLAGTGERHVVTAHGSRDDDFERVDTPSPLGSRPRLSVGRHPHPRSPRRPSALTTCLGSAVPGTLLWVHECEAFEFHAQDVDVDDKDGDGGEGVQRARLMPGVAQEVGAGVGPLGDGDPRWEIIASS